MKSISIKLPEALIKGLDELVDKRVYPTRSDAIRSAVRDLLRRELWKNV